MSNRKKYISFFFLTAFIFIKTVGLHAFIHSEDDFNNTECDICEFVITSNNSPYIASEQFSFEKPVQHNFDKQFFDEYSFQFTQNQLDTTLFCRPPPLV